ncbi:MAG TPA: flagellar hook-length control protein FliK [Burkholderiaceae bacterium]|nr:flagellar hook-length control protein FliK [Burkholderiaceae bacterium]
MPAPLTIPTPGTPEGKAVGPNRYSPQNDGPSPEQRFAALLQQRREAQPQQRSEPKAAAKPPANPTRNDTKRDRADQAAQGSSASAAPPEASTGCEAAKPGSAGKTPTQGEGDRRELPIVDLRVGSPDIAIDGTTPADSSGADPRIEGASHADDMLATDPAFWPAIPQAPTGAATTARGATQDLRIGLGGGTPAAVAAGNAHASLPLAGGATGDAGQHGAGRGDERGTAAENAAALIDAAATSAKTEASTNAAADRFALPPRAPDAGVPGFAAAAAQHRIDASPMPTAALATPLAAPDFAKALGAQVSLFARNGLAQAELQLTPAEMGPIRVHIAIDGAHARVDFAADSAATRQVIERGLPELASALREQGLTLSGGGVFERAPDQRGERDSAQSGELTGRSRRRAAAVDASTQPLRIRPAAVHPGGIDLYA